MAAASLPLALLVAVAASPPQGSHCANHSAGCWFNRAGKNCSAANSERDCGAQLVCLRDLCRQCTADSECNYIPEQVCRQSDAYRICSHKDMWPMDARDVAGLAVAFMATALAAGGGIGGGGLLVPLFIVVLAFTPHDATPLSSIAILGGSLATLALNLRRRNPSGLRGGLRPLISFEVALMMEPLTIAAALIGCVINKVSPGWLLALLLAGLLTHTSWRTMCKGVATWRKESAAADAAVEGYSSLSPHRRPTSTAASPFTIAAATPTNTVVPLMPAEIMGRSQVMGRSEPRSAEIAISPGFGQPSCSAAESDPALRALLRGEARSRIGEVAALLTLLLLCLLLSLLRGRRRDDSPLRVQCGSVRYWGLLLLQVLLAAVFALGVRAVLICRHERKVASGFLFDAHDVMWTRRNTLVYPLTCAVAGLCAGTLGDGGGVIKSHLMLEMGMHPQVSSATSEYLVLFTTAAATMQYALFGALRPHYAGALLCVSFVGSLTGQMLLQALLRQHKVQSLLLLLIAAVVGGFALLMGGMGVINFVHAVQIGEVPGLRPICEAEPPDR